MFFLLNAGDHIHKDTPFSVEGEHISHDHWFSPAQNPYEEMANQAKKGSIILLHNGGKETIKALPGLITRLKSRGFALVTITELLNGT